MLNSEYLFGKMQSNKSNRREMSEEATVAVFRLYIAGC